METRRDDYRDLDAVEQAEFTFDNLSNGLIRFDWIVECESGLRIEPHDDLEPLTGDDADGLVVRRTYEYHAVLEERGNVIRYDGPDLEKTPAEPAAYFDPRSDDHHAYHHVHYYEPFDDEGERIEALDLPDTPTLPQFIDDMLEWHYDYVAASSS